MKLQYKDTDIGIDQQLLSLFHFHLSCLSPLLNMSVSTASHCSGHQCEVFSHRALPLSSELLIKTPNPASGSLSLSFSFTTFFSLFPFLFKHTHTHTQSGAKVGITLQFVPPSQARTLQIFQQQEPITVIWLKISLLNHQCHHFISFLCWPFLFSQTRPILSRASCVRSPKEINHCSPKWWYLRDVSDYRAPQTHRI